MAAISRQVGYTDYIEDSPSTEADSCSADDILRILLKVHHHVFTRARHWALS
jgi:hypothetical protein